LKQHMTDPATISWAAISVVVILWAKKENRE